MPRERRIKTPPDGKTLRILWRGALRESCVEAADLIAQKQRFDALWSHLSQDVYAAATIVDLQRWFGASAAIAVRRLLDGKHMSLVTALDQMAKRPSEMLTFTGKPCDTAALKSDRSHLREACSKVLELAHNEVAHKTKILPLERRPMFSDVANAIEVAYQVASKYDALLSGCTLRRTADGQMLQTVLAGKRFEDIGDTDLRSWKHIETRVQD